MRLFDRIAATAAHRPCATALQGAGSAVDYQTLAAAVKAVAKLLEALRVEVLAIDLDNGPVWAVLDLAALQAGICLVPIPPFFSSGQLEHCLAQAGVQAVLTDDPERLLARMPNVEATAGGSFGLFGTSVTTLRTEPSAGAVPGGVAKVTFTSGTTGEPKGVMLGRSQMEAVVESLAAAVDALPTDRHLCLLPLPILLENIAGLYVPLWCGATALLPPLSRTGLRGAAGLDGHRMMSALQLYGATTAIFTPHMLQVAVAYLEQGHGFDGELRLIAVGGATVPRRLLERAEALGLPVYEGYGLSEAASVVALNRPGDVRPGTVGRPLPHLRLKIAGDGEVLIRDNLFPGYLGEPPREEGWWPTGDVGHLDGDGFLRLQGRRRDLFITAFGRNVSPAWVEGELVLEPAIAQAAVFGEARPWNLAVIVAAPGCSRAAVEQAVGRVNLHLPDYARVSRWVPADAPFTLANGLLSGTGGPRRHAIHRHYRDRMTALYEQENAS